MKTKGKEFPFVYNLYQLLRYTKAGMGVTTKDAVKSKPAAKRGRKAMNPSGMVRLPKWGIS